ncbi:MAG: iron-containing alcohol dehydrogenase [Polyangiales bacterium]
MTTWNFPTRIVFGENAAAQTPQEAKRLGGTRALIVTDPGVAASGIPERIADALRKDGVEAQVFDGVAGNPTDAHALAATEAYQRAHANLVVAVGGGSAIDIGKLVRLCATHDGPLAQYDDSKGGSAKIVKPLPPMLALPTTAGTGSEVGRSGVCTMRDTGKKTIFFAPTLIPSAAILDPLLSVGMPPLITAATGFDALTHCIEAYCTAMDHPMAEAIALEGVKLCDAFLLRAVRDGKDLQARGGMLKAATFGAVAFQKGLGACHSLAHPLSAEHGTHHGLANALCLPSVLDFNRSVVSAKLALIARALGARDEDDETLAFECAGAVRALRHQVGLPEGLGAAGIPESALPKLADLAFEDVCHQENPRPCTRDDLLRLYQSSF